MKRVTEEDINMSPRKEAAKMLFGKLPIKFRYRIAHSYSNIKIDFLRNNDEFNRFSKDIPINFPDECENNEMPFFLVSL